MNKRNYQLELDQLIKDLVAKGERKKLLLHACCAPCLSYSLIYLKDFFDITIYFYNPNITGGEEYQKRLDEILRFTKNFGVPVISGEYDANDFYTVVAGLENEVEGGKRCFECYRLRLEKTAKAAKDGGYDYFCSTLSISPLKNAEKLNAIGEELSTVYGVKHLPNDFKKKGGYLRSVELSKEYGLYRQNFCGCEYSKPKA
jgi:predicted adenine nucleotide alpha hydrolase (AANH) superfamily ATPase